MNAPNGVPTPDAPNGGQPQMGPLGPMVGAGEVMQPTPVQFAFIKTPTIPALYVLRVAHLTGVFAMALNEADMRTFIAKATEAMTGLVVAGPGDLGALQ